MNLPEIFRVYLISQKSSSATIKNYLADVNQFFLWLARKTKIHYQIAGQSIFSLFIPETLEEYKSDLISNQIPAKTINRHLSALRKLGQFAFSQGWITENAAEKVLNVTPQEIARINQPLSSDEEILGNFKAHLQKENASLLTIKNYLTDIRHFLNWLEAVT